MSTAVEYRTLCNRRYSTRNTIKMDLEFFLESVKFMMIQIDDIFNYSDIGQCYFKPNSVSYIWSDTWIVIINKTYLFYDCDGATAKFLDLRQVHNIQLKEIQPTAASIGWDNRCYILISYAADSFLVTKSKFKDTIILHDYLRELTFLKIRPTLQDQQMTKDDVPVVMEKCLDFIYAFGLKTEGIHRIPGELTKVQRLLNLFRVNAHSVILKYTEYSEHDLSSTLKQFLRQFNQPLIGQPTVSFLSVSEMRGTKQRKDAYKQLLQRLPPISYKTLRRLIGHLNQIQKYSSENHMTAINLGMLWGRNIMVDMTTEGLHFLQKEHQVIHDLIVFYDDLFDTTEGERKFEQLMAEKRDLLCAAYNGTLLKMNKLSV